MTDLDEQVEEERWVRESVGAPGAGPSTEGTGPPPTTSVVAVVSGDGIGRIFRSLGVHHLVVGGQTMNPATADLVRAVESVGSDEVVILPNNRTSVPWPSRWTPCAPDGEGRGDRIHRRGLRRPPGLRPGRRGRRQRGLHVRVGHAVVPAEVTRAVRDALTDAGEVHEGDFIGFPRDGVVAVSDNIVVCHAPAAQPPARSDARARDPHRGRRARVADTRRIEEWLSGSTPTSVLEVHQGGQPLYPYLLGIE